MAFLVIVAWLAVSAVNAAIRDGVFSNPMLLLLGLALAAARPPRAPTAA
jgi:hypothetical protein